MTNYNNSRNVSKHISQITREKNDNCFVNQYVNQSRKNMEIQMYPYRDHPCDKVLFQTSHPLYLHHNISPGHVNNCKVNTDSKLTRSQLTFKPVDNLAESVNKEFAFYHLTKSNANNIAVNQNYRHNNASMTLATTVPEHPQYHINPNFDRIGVSTRDYSRKNSLYYKNAGVNNHKLNIQKTVGPHGRWSKF